MIVGSEEIQEASQLLSCLSEYGVLHVINFSTSSLPQLLLRMLRYNLQEYPNNQFKICVSQDLLSYAGKVVLKLFAILASYSRQFF